MDEINPQLIPQPPQPPPQRHNPLLDRLKLPGETFTLPSGGLFYNDGEVLDYSVTGAEVHVHPMTTLDEITLKTPDLLFNGQAVNQVFARCIPEVVNAGKLLQKDVDYLLACLRKVSYGDALRIDYKHDCKDAKEHSYEVDISQFIRNAKRIDPTTVGEDFSITFPNGQTAKFQPLLYKDFVSVMQALNMSTEDDSPEQIQNEMVKSLSGLVIQVEDITDRDLIVEWLKNVPPQFISIINDKTDAVSSWGTDFTATFKCLDCGEVIETSIPLNPLSFFM